PRAVDEPRAVEPSVLQAETFKPVALSAPDYSLGSPGFAKPKMKEYPEFVSILLKAVEHFGIDASAGVYPGVKTLKAYFVPQRLSNGLLISPRAAGYLATFCRGVPGMKGGHINQTQTKG